MVNVINVDGDKVRKLRKERRWTQKDLGITKMVEKGFKKISVRTIQKIENDPEFKCSTHMIYSISKVLETDTENLLIDKNEFVSKVAIANEAFDHKKSVIGEKNPMLRPHTHPASRLLTELTSPHPQLQVEGRKLRKERSAVENEEFDWSQKIHIGEYDLMLFEIYLGIDPKNFNWEYENPDLQRKLRQLRQFKLTETSAQELSDSVIGLDERDLEQLIDSNSHPFPDRYNHPYPTYEVICDGDFDPFDFNYHSFGELEELAPWGHLDDGEPYKQDLLELEAYKFLNPENGEIYFVAPEEDIWRKGISHISLFAILKECDYYSIDYDLPDDGETLEIMCSLIEKIEDFFSKKFKISEELRFKFDLKTLIEKLDSKKISIFTDTWKKSKPVIRENYGKTVYENYARIIFRKWTDEAVFDHMNCIDLNVTSLDDTFVKVEWKKLAENKFVELLEKQAVEKEANQIKINIDQEEFIERAMKVHPGGKYDYSNIKFDFPKVTLDCIKHGEFKIHALNHLEGSGCPICTLENKTNIIISEEETDPKAMKALRDYLDSKGIPTVIQKRPS